MIEWFYIFWLEIPLVMITTLYWLVAPNHYWRKVIGVLTPGPGQRLVLRLYAGVTLTLVGGYYANLLWFAELTDVSFIGFQVMLLVGDLMIMSMTLVYMHHQISNWGLIGQVMMAALWAILRFMFLMEVVYFT